MNVIFTCGGTGGHINPALAVANIWKERHPDSKILFIGGVGNMEEELVPKAGYELSEVTRNLHENGPVGVMTDYEAKFHEQGLPINRLVATMEEWEEVFPNNIKKIKERWLDAFAEGAPEAELGKHVLAEHNYLWHLFSYKMVPCLKGDAARQARPNEDCYLFYCEHPPFHTPRVRHLTAEEAAALTEDHHPDWYLVDKDFTWTYVSTHENGAGLGPYSAESNPNDTMPRC